MTRYKEYLRAHGVPLECDYEILPCEGVEHVWTSVLDNGVVATTCSNVTDSWSLMYNKHGECIVFKSYDDMSDMFSSCYGPEFTSWMCNTSCEISSTLFTVAVGMYKNDAKVRMAFKHMKAGIMDEQVFHRWLSKCYQRYMSILEL